MNSLESFHLQLQMYWTIVEADIVKMWLDLKKYLPKLKL